MWFGRVLLNLHKFLALGSRADRYFRHERPDAVILIDYPGFHWWIAWRAKVRGIPVFYYVPPQLWAWAGWRVKKVRKYVDHVLCSLPFEPAWYHAAGRPRRRLRRPPVLRRGGRTDPERDVPVRASPSGRPGRGRAAGFAVAGDHPQRADPDPRRGPASRSSRPDARFVVACLREKHAARVRRN